MESWPSPEQMSLMTLFALEVEFSSPIHNTRIYICESQGWIPNALLLCYKNSVHPECLTSVSQGEYLKNLTFVPQPVSGKFNLNVRWWIWNMMLSCYSVARISAMSHVGSGMCHFHVNQETQINSLFGM